MNRENKSMGGKFSQEYFANIDLNDSFFDSLKQDYPGTDNSTGFRQWFVKKAANNDKAIIFKDGTNIGAFIYLKPENEPIELTDNSGLPAVDRIKIGTVKISDDHRGQRIGEGAIGLALWHWQHSHFNEVYLTVFPKHKQLINLLLKFGFSLAGKNRNGENVYIKSRKRLDYSTPYTSFPFLDPDFDYGGYIIFEDSYHDTMFPYSAVKCSDKKFAELNVANGLSKVYVSQAPTCNYFVGEPVLIYRKHNGPGQKIYKSCVTSFCVITNIIRVKKYGKSLMPFEKLLEIIGNKSVFDKDYLRNTYDRGKNMIILELLYCSFFGAGNNVNCAYLQNEGLWAKGGQYPTSTTLTRPEFESILKRGGLDVQNIIIN